MNQISCFSCFSNSETLNLHQGNQFTEFISNSDFFVVSNKLLQTSVFINFDTVACVAIQSLLSTQRIKKQRTLFEACLKARFMMQTKHQNGSFFVAVKAPMFV